MVFDEQSKEVHELIAQQHAVVRGQVKIKDAKYYEANKGKCLARAYAWKSSNPDKVKAWSLKRYGITLEEKQRMLALQGGVCALCSSSESDSKKGWHVDHNHITGNIRGILCHQCNVGIGYLKNKPQLFTPAVNDYLQR